MIRRLFGIAAFIIILIAAGTRIAYAFENVTVYVTSSYNQVTFTVSDPRALQHLQSAALITVEDFETEVIPDWQPAEGGPGESWTVKVDPELAQILFRTDIPLLWDITGPWQQNVAKNGIVRGKLSTYMPFLAVE